MNRRRKREERTKKNTIGDGILWIVVGIAIISFIVSYITYSKKLSMKENNEKDIQKITSSSNNSKIINILEDSEETSSSIGKGINELENITSDKKENKIDVNTSKIEEKKNIKKEKQKDNEKKIEKKEISKNGINQNGINQNNENAKENKKEKKNNKIDNKLEDITFIKPVEGEIIKDYSKVNLIYSNTLEEWTTHLGIDYKAEKTDIVKSVADGKIKSIKNDPRYGLTIVIEHSNGFTSSYSSLLTAEFVKVGEKVKKGQTIATVGNTARFEVADETHLHFELKKDGENVDPNIYIK